MFTTAEQYQLRDFAGVVQKTTNAKRIIGDPASPGTDLGHVVNLRGKIQPRWGFRMLRGGRLQTLTRDHTIVEELVDRYGEPDAGLDELKNDITGTSAAFEPASKSRWPATPAPLVA